MIGLHWSVLERVARPLGASLEAQRAVASLLRNPLRWLARVQPYPHDSDREDLTQASRYQAPFLPNYGLIRRWDVAAVSRLPSIR